MSDEGKTLKSLPEGWKEFILEKSKNEGWGATEIIAEFDLTREIHARFRKEYPEYDDAFKMAEIYCEAWWIAYGRENMTTRYFNVGLWAFNMKNRHKWRDTPLSKEGNASILPDKTKEAEISERYKKKKEDPKVVSIR